MRKRNRETERERELHRDIPTSNRIMSKIKITPRNLLFMSSI